MVIGYAPGAGEAVRLTVRSGLIVFRLPAFAPEPKLGRMYFVTRTRLPFFLTVSVLPILAKKRVRPALRASEMST